MVTHNKELLMAFVYFDQSHCGYLLERDLEEILYTLGLHLSRAQVNTICSVTRCLPTDGFCLFFNLIYLFLFLCGRVYQPADKL